MSIKKPDAPKYLFPPSSVHQGWRKKYPVGAGMKNRGNTCYLNSALQALFHVPAFVSWLLDDREDHGKDCAEKKNNHCLACSLAEVLVKSHVLPVVVPARIYNQLPMINQHLKRGRQEDSHEFMRNLLGKLEDEFCKKFKSSMRNSKNSFTTPIHQIFGGHLLQEVTCLKCKSKATSTQYFSDLVVELRINVKESVWGYFKPTRIKGYACGRCQSPQEATMRMILFKAPNVLCIQLKRFDKQMNKINLECSVTTDMNMGRDLNYKFLALVEHHGPRSNCGYYSSVVVAANGSIYRFDDEQVLSSGLCNLSFK